MLEILFLVIFIYCDVISTDSSNQKVMATPRPRKIFLWLFPLFLLATILSVYIFSDHLTGYVLCDIIGKVKLIHRSVPLYFLREPLGS